MTTAMNLKTHVKEYFEDVSHVLFFKDAWFGAALVTVSLLFQSDIFVYGFLASLIGYFYSIQYRTPRMIKDLGLITINGYFFGIALASLFHRSPQFYLCFVLGAMAIPLVTKAVFEVLQHWKLNPLIAPYIFAVWVLYLCADGMGLRPDPNSVGLPTAMFVDFLALEGITRQMVLSLFYGMSQIFFLKNADYGLVLLLLISVFSLRRGLYFLIGSMLATTTFYLLSEGSLSWQLGLFSYSAGLIGLGLASMPEKFSLQTILLFCVLSLFVTVATDHFFKGLSLPILSLPFVVTFWFALLTRVPRLNVSWAPAEVI